MRGAGYIGVAVHAGEHAAVDGIFESLRIYVQADRFAVDVMSQGRIAVAGEAFICGGLGRIFLAGGMEGNRG